MIPIIAWRNIWRNPTRSLVVIFAIALGIWAALFMTGFATGMVNSYLNNTIENVVSHIQIHNPDFLKDGDIKYVINQPERIEQYLQTQDSIRSYSFRTIANGMITSTQGVRGIKVQGVNPDQEIKVTRLDQRIVDGTYFDAEKKGNQVFLSSRLADKLKIKLRSKVVLTFQDMQGDVVPVAFRVVGLFDTGNNPYDDVNVFVLSEVLNNHIRYAAGENTSSQQQAQDSRDDRRHEAHANLAISPDGSARELRERDHGRLAVVGEVKVF